MPTPDQSRWHQRLRRFEFRERQTPASLLRASVLSSLQERTVVRAATDDTLRLYLKTIYEAPRDVAEACRRRPPPDCSLSHDEYFWSAMTCVLGFVAHIQTTRPTWLIDTHLGKLTRDAVKQVRTAVQAPDEDLVDALHLLERDVLERERWPDPSTWRVVVDALARSKETPDLATRRVLAALAAGGPPALFGTFMCAALERARDRSHPSARGLQGALECVAVDVAAPLCRVRGLILERDTPANRRPLFSARQAVLHGQEWDWAQAGWQWTSETRDALEHLSRTLH